MTIKTTISGCNIEIYTDCGQTLCDVSKGRFYASLAALEAEGVLWDSNCEEALEVSPRTIAEIAAFAINHGW